MNKNTPVAIVAFNRPKHLEGLLESLIRNKEHKDTKLYFFIDRYLNLKDKENNSKVISVCQKDWGFKDQEIIINKTNLGLKKQILKTGNYLSTYHDSFILLEDDLLVGEYFLDFMNSSLKVYKDYDNVFHISGYNFNKLISRKNKSYFTKLVHPWGWATWSDKWLSFTNSAEFDKNFIKDLNKKNQKKFNFSNLASYTGQLEKNENNLISTWAVFWYQHIFLSNGYAVIPGKSLTKNIGFDGSGVNSGKNKNYLTELNNGKITEYPEKINNFNTALVDNYIWHFKYKLKDFFEYHTINKFKK